MNYNNYYSYDKIPEDEHFDGYPTSRRALLQKMIGQTVRRFFKLIGEPPEEEADEAGIALHRLFSLAGGAFLELDDDFVVGFGSMSSWVSVVVWLDHASKGDGDGRWRMVKDGEALIEATDPRYSEPRYTAILGKRIATITVLRHEPNGLKEGSRPDEVGVVICAEDGTEVILSHGIHGSRDEFAVITRDEIHPDIAPHLRPILVLTGPN